MITRCFCPKCNALLRFDRAGRSTVKCPTCNYEGNIDTFKKAEKGTCPSCNYDFDINPTTHDPIVCPKCKYKGSVSDFSQGTVIPGNAQVIYKPGKLELLETDAQWLQPEKTIVLKRGINTLGRMSPNSTSSIQLPTNDEFMSKNHAIIDVVMKADGVFDHLLSDNGSKNGTFHEGDRLEKGDIIKLMPGNIIKLGHTFFKFVAE